jgi:hypothetical protein
MFFLNALGYSCVKVFNFFSTNVHIEKVSKNLNNILRGGSGLIFLGSGWAWVEGFGLGLLKFKIWLEAFKSRALITGLKICTKL